ncbi:MAG: hypothetical protein LBL90_09375 [Prevotellaceae bacterium]|jgi:5-formyltetrahydrofolate cyclo-ligase|nr:hypothetical protein [Prevotellaceae bacterium]
MSDEMQTQDFILRWQDKKSFALPVVKGESLALREFTGVNELERSTNFNLLEPNSGKLVNSNDIDLIIVPGAAFDIRDNRLGRGKHIMINYYPVRAFIN